MRSTRSLTAILILAAALAAGCSERASRITGNERLLRGSEGLGTTVQYDTLVDRDTYISPASTQLKGATLLVGNDSTGYQSRALLRPITWTLPDTLALIDTVRFRIDYDPKVVASLPPGGAPYALHLAGAAWDTTTVQWPGPPLGTLLGTGPDVQGPLTIDLGTSALSLFRAAAAAPASFTGFVLSLQSGSGVRGFIAGTGRIEIVYRPSGGGTAATAVTRLATDLSIQTTPAPATGSEPTLVLGGFSLSEVLLRAPIAPPPAGFSINAARFVTRIAAPFPDTVEVRAYRIHNAWTESGVPPDTLLGLDTAPLAILSRFYVRASDDSLTIPIPIDVARAWSADSSSNHGILVRITNSYDARAMRLASRESGTPPLLRVTITSPPPGRF